MNALLFFMRVLEILFLIGLAGSAVVVAISFVEDLWVLLGWEKPEAALSATAESNGGSELQRTPMRSSR